jgi:stearoyl-CoA desaturase (delta-9 desaturase)
MAKQAIINKDNLTINWPVTFFLAAFHLGAIAALFMFSWSALAVAVLLWWLAGSPGIGMGYHRLLTHRGFKTPKWIEYILTVCGTLALEGGPISWVATHRIHHAFTEKDGDPHSPRDGFFWSHMGWIIRGDGMHNKTEGLARYAPDLAKDKFYVWLTHWHWIPQVILAVILYALGGWAFVFWGIFVRVVFSWHATWFVNSAAHVWGARRFETKDTSRNLWWVALIAHGEGWHNNHHAYPAAARHGLKWYEIDVNWYGIRALELLGLAKNIRLIDLKSLEAEQSNAPIAAAVEAA